MTTPVNLPDPGQNALVVVVSDMLPVVLEGEFVGHTEGQFTFRLADREHSRGLRPAAGGQVRVRYDSGDAHALLAGTLVSFVPDTGTVIVHSATGPKLAERREFTRAPVPVSVSVQRTTPGAEQQAAELVDLSGSGMRLRSALDCEPGELLEIQAQLDETPGAPLHRFLGRVMRVWRASESASIDIGVQLEGLTSAEKETLTSRALQGGYRQLGLDIDPDSI